MVRATRRAWRALACAASLALALAPATASSQTPTFAVDRLVMAGAPGDGIGIWRPDLADRTRLFGQLGIGFSLNPFRKDNYVDDLDVLDKVKGNPLTRQLIAYGDIGAEILGRFSIQIAFPHVLYQTGFPTDVAGENLPAVALRHTAPGDLRLEGRVVLFRTEDRAFKLALNGAAYLPTGNRYSFAGDDGVGASFGFAAEYDAHFVAVTVNAAYRVRPTTVFNEVTITSELLYGLGIYVPLRRGTIRLGGEIFGGFGKGNVGDYDTIPLEWMANGKMYLTPKRQVYIGLGAGTRLTLGYAPDFRGVAVVGGSFAVTDSDPRSPNSRYVFEASTNVDSDHDGIPDDVDACPHEPGEMSSDPDKIGCPRYIRRIRGSSEIEVLRRIEFEFDRSRLLPQSFPILDEVVRLLEANPTIQKMKIEGHTDNQGTEEYNQKLSEERASSVLRYLVEKGIAHGRLSSAGYGLSRPRASNATEDGRQRNRRVEFHITDEQVSAR
jgi:outer membrane protein OmpA-like peptidoglycan-associated protein